MCLLELLDRLVPSFQETQIPRLITPAEKGRDMEPRVIDTYIVQSQAEAQEGVENSFNVAFFIYFLHPIVIARTNKSFWALCFCFRSVTIARAIELKHNAGLIAALALETANYYQKAGTFCCCFKVYLCVICMLT